MKRIVKLLIYFVLILGLSFWIVKSDLISYGYFIKTEFLFTFLGVFIGFALTLYTYITSQFDKMKENLTEKLKNSPEILEDRLKLLPDLHAEIKDDILLLIYSLIIVVAISIGDKVLIELNDLWNEVVNLSNSILLAVFILSVFALWDLVKTSFAISDFIISPKK